MERALRVRVNLVVHISKMWESWFALANSTMFVSDGHAKYYHVIPTTQYQALSSLRAHCRFLCQACLLLQYMC